MVNEKIALLAEGESERAILDLLLDNHKLKFTRDELLEEEVIKIRKAATFQRQHLNHSSDRKLKIYRIHDSKREIFKLGKAYIDKIALPIEEIYTTPEIEILFIIFKGDYQKYTRDNSKSKSKPSLYVKNNYKDLNQCKHYDAVYNFWESRIDDLVNCIKLYAQYTADNINNTLCSLLI